MSIAEKALNRLGYFRQSDDYLTCTRCGDRPAPGSETCDYHEGDRCSLPDVTMNDGSYARWKVCRAIA